MKKVLSIVILSYNTCDLLRDCLFSLEKVRNEVDFEVIVSDNGSVDDSAEMVKKEFPWIEKVIRIGKNLGFAQGNNRAKMYVSGKYVLFLNSDTLVGKDALRETVDYLDKHNEVGAITCRLVLPSGELDKDARRSFITPWIGLTHIFLKLDRLFPNSRLFSRYWYGYISPSEIHEVDAIQGAFFLTRKRILDDLGWFDEDYFLDGEDIDLSWQIKQNGWKIMYYPKVSITHIKGAAKGKNKNYKYISLKEKLKYKMSGVNSMEIFYRKRLWSHYPIVLNVLVLLGIRTLKLLRIARLILSR